MNSSSVTPPQRIRCEALVEWLFFFITYLIGRAFLARRHSAKAAATCTSSDTMSTVRRIQSMPPCGRIGSPKARRCSAYSL